MKLKRGVLFITLTCLFFTSIGHTVLAFEIAAKESVNAAVRTKIEAVTAEYEVEILGVDSDKNMIMTAETSDGENIKFTSAVYGTNEYRVKLPGSSKITIPENWVVTSNPNFAFYTEADGTLTPGTDKGIRFDSGDVATFIDNDTFRGVNKEENQDAWVFTAWYTGTYPIARTVENFKLENNGFVFKDNETTIAEISISETKKLYKPGDEIEYSIVIFKELPGHEITIELKDTNQTDEKSSQEMKNGYAVSPLNTTGSFIVDRNGIYSFYVKLSGPKYNETGKVNIGVIPPNERAEDSFLFGIHTIFCRPYEWGDKFGIKGMDAKSSYNIGLEYVDYCGANAIREATNNFNLVGGMMEALSTRNITLDLNFGGTLAGAIDSDAIDLGFNYTNEDYYKCPPKAEYVSELMTETMKTLNGYDNIIYEIYNEPNSKGFWIGKEGTYLNTLDIASRTLLNLKGNAKVMNGGMVVTKAYQEYGIDPNDQLYYNHYSDMLEENQLSYVAIHHHGTLGVLDAEYKELIKDKYGISDSSIILNESGNLTKSDLNYQAQHTVGKLIWAKANGLSGYFSYYLGLVDTSTNNLTPEAPGDGDYSMISDDLEPKPAFLAYVTAINMLDGAQPVPVSNESGSGFLYLFEKGDMMIEVSIGAEHRDILNKEFIEYDMFGNENGSVDEITYRVYARESMSIS